MTFLIKARAAHRLIAASAIAVVVCGGLVLSAAPSERIRLVGVSTQATGKTAAVLIESSEPVAYAVSRPDPLTVLVDMRNVTVADAANDVARRGPVAGVTVEQATAADGQQLARVRVALASPSAYHVRSARNVIRVELEPEKPGVSAQRSDATPAALLVTAAANATADGAVIPPATQLQKVRASHTRTATTVTLAGDGRLTPSSLTESDDQPRRLVLDFPNVAAAAAARTGVEGAFVKQVRVALNSREPLVTRVVMEISSIGHLPRRAAQDPTAATSRSCSKDARRVVRSWWRRRIPPPQSRTARRTISMATRCRSRRRLPTRPPLRRTIRSRRSITERPPPRLRSRASSRPPPPRLPPSQTLQRTDPRAGQPRRRQDAADAVGRDTPTGRRGSGATATRAPSGAAGAAADLQLGRPRDRPEAVHRPPD